MAKISLEKLKSVLEDREIEYKAISDNFEYIQENVDGFINNCYMVALCINNPSSLYIYAIVENGYDDCSIDLNDISIKIFNDKFSMSLNKDLEGSITMNSDDFEKNWIIVFFEDCDDKDTMWDDIQEIYYDSLEHEVTIVRPDPRVNQFKSLGIPLVEPPTVVHDNKQTDLFLI